MKHLKNAVLPPGDLCTAFQFVDHVELLIRTSDWYKLEPIRRYLFNMASSKMFFADHMTEQRNYSIENWIILCDLWAQRVEFVGIAAQRAYQLWGHAHEDFAIVHTEFQPGEERGPIIGDDPMDADQFALLDGVEVPYRPFLTTFTHRAGRAV